MSPRPTSALHWLGQAKQRFTALSRSPDLPTREKSTGARNHVTQLPVSRSSTILFHTILCLFGFAAFMPWRIILSMADFWRVRLLGSPFESTFESYFFAIFTTFNTVGAAWGTFWPPRFGRKRPAQVRLDLTQDASMW